MQTKILMMLLYLSRYILTFILFLIYRTLSLQIIKSNLVILIYKCSLLRHLICNDTKRHENYKILITFFTHYIYIYIS